MPYEIQPHRGRPSDARDRILALLLTCIGLPWPGAGATAELYRWLDAHGVTHYSSRPPHGGAATRLATDPGPSPEERQCALGRLRTLAEQDLDRREEAERREQGSRDQAERERLRRTHCEAARRSLASLDDPWVARVRRPGGEPQTLTAEARAQYLEEARTAIQENCDSVSLGPHGITGRVAGTRLAAARRRTGILETGST